MTRINLIPPEELSGKHLVAEYRELPRIFGLAISAYNRGEHPNDPRNPPEYTLGKGHVRFFYSRLRFLVKRHRSLVAEMRKRGYATNFTSSAATIANMPPAWRKDYQPTDLAILINRARIAEKSLTKGVKHEAT